MREDGRFDSSLGHSLPTKGTTMKRKPPPTFRVAMRRGLVRGIACTALVAVPPILAISLLPVNMTYAPVPETTVSRTERMVQSGKCWVGKAPSGVTVPGHVWADDRYRGSKAVGKALEQIFEGADHNMTIQAFCH